MAFFTDPESHTLALMHERRKGYALSAHRVMSLPSAGFDSCSPDDACIPLRLSGDKPREDRGRSGHDRSPQIDNARSDGVFVEARIYLVVQPFGDVCGRALRGNDPEPRTSLISGQEIGHGWHIRQD